MMRGDLKMENLILLSVLLVWRCFLQKERKCQVVTWFQGWGSLMESIQVIWAFLTRIFTLAGLKIRILLTNQSGKSRKLGCFSVMVHTRLLCLLVNKTI